MLKTIGLEKITYGKKYKEYRSQGNEVHRDCDNYIETYIELSKNTYTSEDFVTTDKKIDTRVNNVVNGFKNIFENRGRQATEEQLYFAKETAKVVFGKAKDNKISIIPAPCGFGKSTIKLELIKEIIKLYEDTKADFKNGVVIVGDRLTDLRELISVLKNEGLEKYVYMLESWNTDICMDKDIKEAKPKMCFNCYNFNKCKIGQQQNEQKNYPILLMTNARLKECGKSIKGYSKYNNGDRTLLLIDERPEILDTIKVDVKLLSEIKTYIDNLDYKNIEDKTKLLNYWNRIIEEIERKMQSLRGKYKRYVLSNRNNIDVVTEEFMELWKAYMKKDYERELKHIIKVLTEGGFYVCESNKEFISTIGKRDLNTLLESFNKKIIFDGSALYDPLYLSMYKENEEESDVRYLYIKNSRTYENLYINAFNEHKVSKTRFKDIKYLDTALANFINNKESEGFGHDYVVTYKEQAKKIAAKIKSKKVIMPKDKVECYYFGNTKGSNDMEKCNRMFQLGWETMPDYEYVIQWLSCRGNFDKLLDICVKKEKAEKYSDLFIKKDRSSITFRNEIYSSGLKDFTFGLEAINEFQWLDIVSKFYQEIHRTRLRDYNYEEDIEVYLFGQRKIIFDLIRGLFPKCNLNINNEEIQEFSRAKDLSFTKSDGSNTAKQKILKWFNNWDGETFKVSTMLKECGITSKRWEKLKKEVSIKDELDKCSSPKKGYYCRVS